MSKKYRWRFRFLSLILLLISLVALIKPYLGNKFPYTHDGENHLARFANYKIALREGQFPPRFAPNLLNHYGYPVFNYNYPLANILSLPFSLLKFNYELTFKIIAIGSILFGLVGLKKWLILQKVESKALVRLALSAYLLSPYLINLVYVRGNIGELLAMNLFVWLGVMIEKIAQKKWQQKDFFFFSLLATGLLLSHNITAVFATGIILLYALLRFKFNRKYWLKLLKVFIWAIALSLWFWLPALTEKQLIVLDGEDLNLGFSQHFARTSQLLFSSLSFGFSKISPVDSLSFAIGKHQLIIFLLSLVLLPTILSFKAKSKKQSALILIAINLLLAIFQLNFTKSIWQALPLVHYIQFPWRLGLFLPAFLTLLTGLWLSYFAKNLFFKIIIVSILVLQIVSVYRFQPADFFHKTNVDYDAFTQSTSTKNENRTKNFTYKNIADWQPTAQILQGEGDIKINTWNGSKRTYSLDLKEQSTITEPTMNFAGWQTIVNNQKIPYISNEEVAGRIAYTLPAGSYQVQSEFTQKTWPRIIGNSVSLVALLFLLMSKKCRLRNINVC